MAALNSPGKILHLWKKTTSAYLKANQVKALPPPEDFLNKKVVKGLDRLRRVAAVKSTGTVPDAEEFNGALDTTLYAMDKYRRLFWPRRNDGTVKPYYKGVCRLALVVKKLRMEELDASEDDVAVEILDDVDADAFDQADAQHDADIEVQVQNGVPAPPPPEAAVKRAGPPSDPSDEPAGPDGNDFIARLKQLLPRVLQAQQEASQPVKATLALRVSEARTLARKGEVEAAQDVLDDVEHLANELLRPGGANKPDGQTTAVNGRPAAPPPPTVPAPARETTAQWARRIDLSTCKKGKVLGEGAMGAVYRLESSDPNTPPLVIKTVRTERARATLDTEAEVYRKLGDHPNFLKCLGLGVVNGESGLIMEGVQGRDLKGLLGPIYYHSKQGQLSHEERWGALQFVLASTLRALEHAAAQGVVHADIKPENILCDATTGEVKLIDFGVATAVGQATEAGTDGFIGPGVRDNTSADIFAVGGTAYNSAEYNRFRPNYEWARLTSPEALAQARDQLPTALQPETEADPAWEIDYEGKRGKKTGRYAAETAYVEFVNWLMHPDPAKRPTVQEALAHPFLKDRLLDDEAARQVLKGLMQPVPPVTHPVAATPSRSSPARDISSVRPRIADVLRQAPTYRTRVGLANDAVQKVRDRLAVNPSPVRELAALAEGMAELQSAFQGYLPALHSAVVALKSAVPAKMGPDDHQAVADAKDRDELSRLETDLGVAVSSLATALAQTATALAHPQAARQQVRLARRGEYLGNADVARRKQKLSSRVQALAVAAGAFANAPAGPADDRLNAMLRAEEELNRFAKEVRQEQAGLERLAAALTADPPGPLSGEAERAAHDHAIRRVTELRAHGTQCLKDISVLHHQLGDRLSVVQQNADADRRAAAAKMDAGKRLASEVTLLLRRYTTASQTFQAVARKPRQGADDLDSYTAAVASFLDSLKQAEGDATQLEARLPPAADDVRQQLPNFSPAATVGQRDTYGELEGVLRQLETARAALKRLRTLIASDRGAYETK
jgi:serine/threonine protein kinase